MNERTFRRLFPNASEATVKANCEVLPTRSEPRQVAALDSPSAGTKESISRALVRFTCMRRRRIDPDALAFSIKNLLDGLRYARIIKDDSEKHIDLQVTQELVKIGEEPYTVIEISSIE